MDPITHALAGMVIGSKIGAGLTLSNGLMIASTLGAVAPDLDITARFWGDYVYLAQHRKFSHSLPGLALISLGLGAILSLFYPENSFASLFLFAALGAISHTFLDIFNSYGVGVLWPVKKEKITLNLLLIFDPVLFGLFFMMLFLGRNLQLNLLAAASVAGYLLLRRLMRYGAYRLAKKELQGDYPDARLVILPSGFFNWDFIARLPDKNLVGSIKLFKRKVRIVKCLEKVRHNYIQVVHESVLGKYFREFTPFYHVQCELVEEKYVANLMDLRYRFRGRFLHNATLVMDKDLNVEEAVFQPFSLSRRIPVS